MNNELNNLCTLLTDYNNTIIYDGDCPFCNNFVQLIALKKAVPDVKLLNAREHSELVKILHNNNYNLNTGMVFIYQNHLYHKDECVHILALLAEKKNLFNKLLFLSFRNKHISKIIYSILRAGRRLWLLIRGIPLIK